LIIAKKMPYKNSWEQHGVYRKYSGQVTGSDILQAIEEIAADPRYDDIQYVINDFLEIAGSQVTDQEVELIAAMDYAASLSNPNIRLAIVTTDPLMQQLLLQYSAVSPPSFPTEIFSDLDASRLWVGEPFIRKSKLSGRLNPAISCKIA
jgi:hypothetical protein